MSKLLLVIDFINDIVHPEGKLGEGFAPYIEQNNVLESANEAIAYARSNHILIAHVKVGFNKNYLECPESSPIFSSAKKYNALELNTWGTEFHQKMDIQPQDHILVKHRISAFYNTDLECVLRANKVDDIIIAGVSTDMAVEAAARDAHDRDYNIIVLKDACGAHDEKTHNASIENVSRIATVKTVAEWAK